MSSTDILSDIVAHKRIEVEQQKQAISPSMLAQQAETIIDTQQRPTLSFSKALRNSDTGIIAEFKRKSPSKGWIHPEASPQDIVPAYVQSGAAAISILTDAHYFGGQLSHIQQVRASIPDTPILRKDFVIDSYQLYQARIAGADAVLLIAACLTPSECNQLAQLAHQLQLETLLEVHSSDELSYLNSNIDMVGVNNRNLGTFHTDVQNSIRMAPLLPTELPHISESGIGDPQTIRQLRAIGYQGFLIGETFMRTSNPAGTLRSFRLETREESLEVKG